MSGRPDARHARSLLATVLLLAGCGAVPADLPLPGGVRAGTPLEAAVPPPAACEARLRAEQEAALRLRQDLRIEGLPADPEAVAAASTDPTATLDLLGIPVTPAEDAALRDAGIAFDAATPLAMWVNVGRPERFGGIWIDPPGTNRYVVSIPRGDQATLELARCLERPGLDVRYVAAAMSAQELNALQERIGRDWQAGTLDALGIDVVSTGQTVRDGAMVLEIGVSGLTDAERALLHERYGPDVVITEQQPPQPG